MRLLLDTNRYDDMNSGEPDVVQRLSIASEIWVSLVVIGELRAGFRVGSRRQQNERFLARFLSKPQVNALIPSEETTEYYATVVAALRNRGRMIPTNDIWIAAQAMQHNLTLDTRDAHFRQVKGLRLVESA